MYQFNYNVSIKLTIFVFINKSLYLCISVSFYLCISLPLYLSNYLPLQVSNLCITPTIYLCIYPQGAASSPAGSDDNLAMLEKAIPGVPGEDYPIYAEVPESGFSCDGQVDGGYYADPEAECQVFHICTADGQGGLAKYSFLCPNGTIFNQNYFICDWWFNFDCSSAAGLYSLNEDIAAEREAASPAASASAPQGAYASPDAAPIGGYDAPSGVAEAAQAAYGQAARNARNGRGPSEPFSEANFRNGGRRAGNKRG